MHDKSFKTRILDIYKPSKNGSNWKIAQHKNSLKGPFFKHVFIICTTAHCLKITQNVAFQFLNVGIVYQFLSY